MGGIFMRIDLRVKHDIDARKKAAELFGKGRGFESVAKELSIPRSTVRRWQQIWKAFGSEALLSMDGRQARHTCSQKVAAARAVVEDGMSKSDAMARYGIMSLAPLERWCRACREGGAEALRPRPKGRPKGSGAAARPLTREQQLGRRVQQLEAEVAYLEKLRSLAGRGRI
jgi:transposase